MEIFYKCKCMKEQQPLNVPDRVKDTDLMPFMDCVTVCISYDHRQRCPKCYSVEMEYVKIPANATGVGVPPTKQ